MAKPKKKATFISIYMDDKVLEKLSQYCNESGQTRTKAIERIVEKHIDRYFEQKNNNNNNK